MRWVRDRCWDMQEGSTMVTPGYEQTEAGGGVAMTTGSNDQGTGFSQPDQAQFEADKRSVYKHPLFPLLALLFERCEQATQSAECPNSESFNMDIQAFVQHQERDRKPFLMNDPEVDGLMIKAIQVLRIHLLELEKVQELCKDFCNRYITCLKGKMQSENLLRSDYASYENNNNNNNNNSSSNSHSSNSNSPAGNTNYATSPHTLQVVSSAGGVPPSHHQGGGGGGAVLMSTQPQSVPPSSSQIAYQMVQTAQGLVAAPVHLPAQAPSPGIVHGSTPLSQIGANPCPPPSDSSLLHSQLSPAPTTPGSVDDDDDFLSNKKKQKRGVLPKHATSVMRSWLFQHLVHPYPTEDEKRHIAAQTNLTLLQVNNWFINARRRILQPMLDASNPAATDQPSSGNNLHSKSSSSKKAKHSGNGNSKQAAQRFWPENIASLQPQLNLSAESNGATHTDSSLISSTVLSSEESEGSSQDEDEEEEFEEEGEEQSQVKLEGDASSDSEQPQ
ncbi:homeobox protein PKNOX2-like isoform X2 [Zootermopsis nevadensis]|uniref:homeobox protein PKNOX2-like isoform X2 n=1 Tax=Zootermopsis nevadensis TaxID=136037 RepID=UPI000B8EDEC0|nr:homeobox protein PKNOX2-like isoform X2 [Zootermopsis nevadensis]